jgi:lipoate-protein ligase A
LELFLSSLQGESAAIEAALPQALLEHSLLTGQRWLLISRPEPAISFSRSDQLKARWPQALKAASESGVPVLSRTSGGSAVAAHPGCLKLTWSAPHAVRDIAVLERFKLLTDPLLNALSCLGADARLGQVKGEWCPGSHSVNIAGLKKIAGLGQRSCSGGHHLCAIVLVSDAKRTDQLLAPIHKALGCHLSQSADLENLAASFEDLSLALQASLAGDYRLKQAELPAKVRRRAADLAAGYLLA